MANEEISKKFFSELIKLSNTLNLPPAEVDKYMMQYIDIAELTEDPDLLTRLADDLLSAILQRANQGVPDNVPDELIVEDIAKQEAANKTFEVSTKGDDLGKQFSALNATFKEGPYKGRTIEDVWQNEIKKSGKGRPPAEDSILFGKDYQVSKNEYQKLWQMWADENPELINELKAKVNEGYNLVDSFAGDPNKTVNQAEALTNIISTNKFTDDFFDPNAGKITSLPDNHIFVFGSNEAGRHGKGAALDAVNNFGAETGKGFGLQGQSFAIPTKDGNLNVLDNKRIQHYVNQFLEFAKQNKDKTFVFNDIGTGLAGKDSSEIASMLSNKTDNVIISKNFNNNLGGGSVGAAKRNDPLFPEKIEEYDPQIHGDFKEKVLDKFNVQEQKFLDYYNNHDVVKASGLNGESVLLGIVKAFGYDVFEKYNSLSGWNPIKWTGKFSKFLFKGMISILDPVGEGIETAVKIGTKTGAIKDGAKLARLGGVASNWRYELTNQVIWQGTAAMVATVDNAADALNSVLDEYGLLPEFVKERIDVVPYEDLNKHLAHQSRYWQSAGWQGSKLTSLWYNLDTMLPSRLTGNTPHNWAIQKFVGTMLPERFELEADEQDYWDIITGQREFKQNTQDGFFGWWKNEIEQTGQLEKPSYFAQVNNPDLNVYNANSHVDTWNKLNQIKDRFGPGIMDMAGYDINMYNNLVTGDE